jgi:UDP-glucose 4-epimerase
MVNNSDRILLLGGTGFIGCNFVSALKARNFPIANLLVADKNPYSDSTTFLFQDVLFEQLDIANTSKLIDLLFRFQPTLIIHLAANSDIRASIESPSLDLRNTLTTTTSLATAVNRFPIQKLVFASTSAVYGDPTTPTIPITEDSVGIPISSYGWMKLASEETLINSYNSGYIKNLKIFRFPNVVGEFLTHGVIFDLCNQLMRSQNNLQVLGNGAQTKPFVLASELVAAILKILYSDEERIVFNLSTNSQTSVMDLVGILIQVSKTSPQINWGTDSRGWKGDVPRYQLDTANSNRVLGKNFFSNSTEAVRFSVGWMWKSLNA